MTRCIGINTDGGRCRRKSKSLLCSAHAPERASPSPDDQLEPCAICWDAIEAKPCRVACGHSFHEACLYKWFVQSDRCPLCRGVMTKRARRRIAFSPSYRFFGSVDRTRRELPTRVARADANARIQSYLVENLAS